MIKIAPSVLACDFARLGEEVSAMESAGADMIHLDIMDGHFVPNISFGATVIASLSTIPAPLKDLHLMISDPLAYLEDFARAGAEHISFHVECNSPVEETLERIRALGMKTGLVLKPGTGPEVLEPYVDKLDMVLVMTVEPGFGGQPFLHAMLDKIAAVRRMAERRNPALDIQVDGGIDGVTAPLAASYGANVFVAGTSLFSAADYRQAVDELREKARSFTKEKWR